MSQARDKNELGACSVIAARAAPAGRHAVPDPLAQFTLCLPRTHRPAACHRLPARSADVRRELSYNLRRCLNFFAVVLLANHFFACLIYLVLRVQDFPAGACRRRAVSLAQKTYVM